MADTEQNQDRTGMPSALRVSHQPVMVAGLTGSEFIMWVSAGFAVAIFTCAIFLPILPGFHFSLLAGSLVGVGASYVFRLVILRVKRQKPDGYALQLFYHARHGIEPIRDLVSTEGQWDPMRHSR